MQPYLVILVSKPTQKEVFDNGAVPTIIAGPQAVMAESETQATARAMKFMPDEWRGKEERVEAYALPFRRNG